MYDRPQNWQASPYYPQQPPPKKRAKRVVLIVVAVVLVAAAAGAAVVFWPKGDDLPSHADLPTSPGLSSTAFPDPDSFSYGEGVPAMCAALDKIMTERGYLHISDGTADGGQYCRFITPGLSMLEDGSYELRVEITAWRDNAEARFGRFLQLAQEKNQSQKSNPDYRVSTLEQFPSGDAGFVFHRESPSQGRADTEAYLRSGDDLVLITVWGGIQHVTTEDQKAEPLTREITYREITDILTAITGDGEPGPAQITPPGLAEHRTLAGLAEPALPEGATTDAVCERVQSVAAQLEVQRKSSGGCTFEAVDGSDADREIIIGVGHFDLDGNTLASEQLARDLRSTIQRTSEATYQRGSLYGLPFGDTGYVLPYSVESAGTSGYVDAAYVTGRETYVLVQLRVWRYVDGDRVAPSEDERIADMATVLTAMGGPAS